MVLPVKGTNVMGVDSDTNTDNSNEEDLEGDIPCGTGSSIELHRHIDESMMLRLDS